jgi:glycosyltransferase involved in cell wall biosynthesis
MKKIKILIVTTKIPYPLVFGGDQAQFNILYKLQDIFDIYLAYNARYKEKGNKQSRLEFQKLCPKITVLPYIKKKKWENGYDFYISFKQKIITLFGHCKIKTINEYFRLGVSGYDQHSFGFLNFVADCLVRYKIDILQTEFCPNLGMVFTAPKTVKTVFVHHELQFVRNQRYLEQIGTMNASTYYYSKFLKNEEISILNQYNRIIVFSEQDKEALVNNGVTTEIKISVPTVAYQESKFAPEIKNVISFIGSSQHTANYDGVIWFLENIWTLIKQKNPLVEFHVIGIWDKNLSTAISKQYNGVNFLGFIEDLETEIAGTIMVVPILIGSGVRMKILEAANHAVPIVSTIIGIEGLNFTNGLNALIADNPQTFAENVLAVLTNNELRYKLSENAKKHFDVNYSSEVVANERKLIIENLHSENK